LLVFDPAGEIDPDTKLDRAQTASALSARGYKTAESTLASLATRGGGPPYAKFGGSHVLYRWGDSLGWAQKRLSAIVNSTSELRSAIASKEKAAADTCGGKHAAAPAGRDQATMAAKKTSADGAARARRNRFE
jgi:hypothetical protein